MFCQNCGKQLPDGAKFCTYCGARQAPGGQDTQPRPQTDQRPAYTAPQHAQAPRPAQAPQYTQAPRPAQATQRAQAPRPAAARYAPQERENVLMGTLGALLGSLGGVVVMVVLNMLGFVAALSGIVMTLGAVWGYSRLGKAISVKGLIISTVIVAVMVYVGTNIYWAIEISRMSLYGFSGSFGAISELVEQNSAFADAYYEMLMQQYLFAGLGAVITIVRFAKEKKRDR